MGVRTVLTKLYFRKIIKTKEFYVKKLFILILLFTILTASPLFAKEPEDIFPYFLFMLVERHEEIETLAMPNVEFLVVPGMDDAAYMITFKSAEDINIFLAALRKEDIPNGTFPGDNLRLLLFHSDLLYFILDALCD